MADDPTPKRTPRTSVMLAARLAGEGLHGDVLHRVANLSETGIALRLADDTPVTVGAAVSVTIGGVHAAPAEVMWLRGGVAGLRFAAPISVDAARSRRPAAPAAPGTPLASGWIADHHDPYRRRAR